MKGLLGILAAYVAAVAATTVIGTLLQTQLNLAQLAGLGMDVDATLRGKVTLRDLAGFAPTFGVLVAAAFLVAFPVTALIRRRVHEGRSALYALAGAVAITAMLVIMHAALGLTAIAAARGAGGFVGLVLTGAIGGWVFAAVCLPRD